MGPAGEGVALIRVSNKKGTDLFFPVADWPREGK